MGILDKARVAWRRRGSLGAIVNNSTATYSQFAEDIIFDRLLRPGNKGTYVDVGANHPVEGSNTYKLYTKGWSGLAIDPNPQFAPLFTKSRPRDIYLTEGCASTTGMLTYFSFENNVLNTFDLATVEKLKSYGQNPIDRREISCRPLANIVSDHLGGAHIDLLNVDCEGFDLDVLKSLDLTRNRPTIIFVEDYARYLTFRDAVRPLDLELYLRREGYAPIAQIGWSGLYIAHDWQDLFKRSAAFDESHVQNGCLPQQATLESVGVDHYEPI